MALTKTSKLQAINTMLGVIGEAPINTLEPTTSDAGVVSTNETADVSVAKRILEEVSRETQSAGWHFNREVDVSLSPTADDEILIPNNAASIDVEPKNSSTVEYVQRGEKLYNKTDHTFTITSTLKCTIIYMLDWEDLPQTARHYIMIKSARRLQDRSLGSDKHNSFNQLDEVQALIALKASEADGGDFSIFDNYSVYRTIDRMNTVNRVRA